MPKNKTETNYSCIISVYQMSIVFLTDDKK